MSSDISNINEKQIYHSSSFPISLRNYDQMTIVCHPIRMAINLYAGY